MDNFQTNYLTEVSLRIQTINNKEALALEDMSTGAGNLLLSKMEFHFRNIGSEELELADEFQDKLKRTYESFARNFDVKDPEYVNLLEELRSRFEKVNIEEMASADMVESTKELDSLRAKMNDLNRRNAALAKKYDGDEKFAPLPDVLLIDGGETHAQVALRVTERFGLAIPIFGMVKDDRHRTRALVTPEGREIGIKGTQAVFTLIGRIQEETHRFAITYNRQSHGRSVRGSVLDEIPGVGEARRTALLRRFKSVKAVREASLEELEEALPRNAAAAVYLWAHPPAEENPQPPA